MSSIESQVRALADRAELEDLVARHSLWIDESRFDETERIFTEDVVVESPRGQARGIEALVGLVSRDRDKYARMMHSKGNIVIDLKGGGGESGEDGESGDTATVRAHDVAVFVIDEQTTAVAAGVHHYGACRTPDGWRFDRLEVSPVALTEALGRVTGVGAPSRPAPGR